MLKRFYTDFSMEYGEKGPISIIYSDILLHLPQQI